ncbi:NADP-dependent oxidoreductase domain-containing protein [Mycena rosella]|uniref:NADP-dependent oxidoreductase domain-containing protein n=1 Tax=Mycena rosella TaxID=1033263 RepID=A0AAD7GXL0_MYCRO|nr:NADP-dependent oxidoreductase domain-containing protein [Mycena rosella]
MSSATVPSKKMEYVCLGNSDLKISKIVLGCMSYEDPLWLGTWVLPEEASKHIKAVYDAGINIFDTANVYSNGLSEEILGRVIKQHALPKSSSSPREQAMLGISDDAAGFVNQCGLSRKHIDSVKHSLRHLQLDYIDVLQCHRLDPDTPIEETMQALHDVVQTGYVRYLGMSSCYAWQYYAINKKLTPFLSMQNHYNMLYREEEGEMMPTLKHFGVGAIPWLPLVRGGLTRPLVNQKQTKRGGSDLPRPTRLSSKGKQSACRLPVEEIAKKRGISMAQVSVAWVLSKEGVSAPIVGTTSLANLADIIGKPTN